MASEYLASKGIDLDRELEKVQLGEMPFPDLSTPLRTTGWPPPSKHLSRILGVRLPKKPVSSFWDVSIADGRIASVDPHDADAARRIDHLPEVLSGRGRLLAPSLCHAHIHLDKCFLLQDPEFADLFPEVGTFNEALTLTETAKSRFTIENLLKRGRQLLQESIEAGVTALRAFVEVDPTVQFLCLDAGLQLKAEFAARCDVQLCAFAQQPLFSADDDGGHAIRGLMREAVRRDGVDVVGSTPYVEADEVKMRTNVSWIMELALANAKALDLHLDYFLDREPLVWEVLQMIHEHGWSSHRGSRGITLGHCTRLTAFGSDEWSSLKKAIGDLPISFVGLPTSDLFMMGSETGVRGTLDIPRMIRDHGFQAAIAVNNVGNAFTPQGSCDPLSVASLGVGVYQAGTKQSAEILYECVSSRAKSVIGCDSTSLDMAPGEPADFVLFDGPGENWRMRKTVAESVYHGGAERLTIKNGRVTSN